MRYEVEVLKYNQIWCRFDGKCWGECKSEYSDWSGFCSEKANSLSRFDTECSLVIGVGNYYQNACYEMMVAPISVSVKFHRFPDDYEIEVLNSCSVSFLQGDRYSFETMCVPANENEMLGWVRKTLDSRYVTQYINDEVLYRLGIDDDGKLASEIADSIAHKVVLEIFH